MKALDAAGHQLLFVTNNATKTPAGIAEKIRAVVGYDAEPDQVIGSAVAAASMLEARDEPVFVFGEGGLRSAVEARGFETTNDWRKARAVVVGLNRSVTYELVSDAASAVRGGARFVAANTDSTYPTPDGLLPGAGTWVAAIAVASGREPEVAGKPHRPTVDLVASRAQSQDVWVVGDRAETDLAMAEQAGWKSVLVLTGVGTRESRLPSGAVPDLILDTVADLLDAVSEAS